MYRLRNSTVVVLIAVFTLLVSTVSFVQANQTQHIATTPSLAESRLYQENASIITYTGMWDTINHTSANNETYITSQTSGDQIEIQFSGDSIVLYRMLSPNGGQAIAKIDGEVYGEIEFFAEEQHWQVPAFLDNLGSGPHTLTLEVSTERNLSSLGYEVTLDALQIPGALQPTLEQQQAWERVNWYREQAKLHPLRLSNALNSAAQAHADYDIRHAKTDGHRGIAGKIGYIGEWPSDRAQYFGYGSEFVGENMHGLAAPIASVDAFMATVYHRLTILDYRSTDMGYGIAYDEEYRSDVLDVGGRGDIFAGPANRTFVMYPADSQQNTPLSWDGSEWPDPLPETEEVVGYPVSLTLFQKPQWDEPDQWQLSHARLYDETKQLVDSYVLDKQSDPNNYLGPDTVFIIARKSLKQDTTYTASIAGTDNQGQSFNVTWSFQTGGSISYLPFIKR